MRFLVCSWEDLFITLGIQIIIKNLEAHPVKYIVSLPEHLWGRHYKEH